MNNILQPELQLQTLRLYGEFLCRRKSWAGQLALAAFAGAGGSGFAAAASLAGASSLVVDANSAEMKVHFRDGAFDFVVNTLDEAVRALKNEIRVGRPIAIGLMVEPASALQEAGERGLAAALILCDPDDHQKEPLAVVSEVGVVQINYGKLLVASPEFDAWLSARGWSPVEVDGALTQKPVVETLAAGDGIRQKWWRDLPAHQRSVGQGSRWVWMSANEEREMNISPESH